MSRRSRPLFIAGIATLSALLWPAGREACAQQATLTKTRDLDFGRIVALGGGTVVVSPAGGGGQGNGVIVLKSSGNAATFTVGGNAGKKSAVISFPNTSIQITNANKVSMTVDNFVSLPAKDTPVSPATAANVSVGATLHVNLNQEAGAYSGTFPITVNFQ